MPRKPRIISSTGIYHIILRSVNQHIIFEEESDYKKFLFILSDCKEKYDTEIYAYCLMDNHVHLMLHAPSDQLSSFFQSLGTRFARWYNKKYSRSGHLFQDRFFSTTVENDQGFLATLVYIHNNPVKANMCRFPSEYRWSSISAYYGAKNPLVDVTFAYEIIGSKDSLLHYFARKDVDAERELFTDIHREGLHFHTDEAALEIFKSVTNLPSTSAVSSIGKIERNLYVRTLKKNGLTVKQIARFMDISLSTVKRICKMNP